MFYGYNAKKYTYGNLFKQGVIDPAKVLRVALENAVSVSNLFLNNRMCNNITMINIVKGHINELLNK